MTQQASAFEEDPRKFAALRNRSSATYISGGALSMMADNIEHVLGYWVLWQVFQSPWLVGFQIVSHWLPYLLFSVYAGALAEKYDCRRIIQIAQGLFMAVSLAWGILFLTGALELWHAVVLLVLHGLAGCLWMPAEQMMLYDFVGPKQLPGAVRINSTFRSLAFIAGPIVGSALLLTAGPGLGMLINILFYLPLTIFLARTKTTGHNRDAARGAANDSIRIEPSKEARTDRMTIIDAFRVLSTVRRDRLLFGMVLLSALSAVTIGAVLQNAMPEFADIFGAGSEGFAYGVLLFANGVGGVAGGFLLEATRRVPATGATAACAAVLLGLSTVGFALAPSLAVAVIALIAGGLARITADSTEMSIVQLEAPVGERGRIIGAYTMFGPGMMTFSGVTVAVLGSWVGLQGSVLVGGAVLTFGAALVWLFVLRGARPRQTVEETVEE